MADMRITGMRGGAGLPPENRKTKLSEECQESIAHTKEVAEKMVFTRFDGVTLNVTDRPPIAEKINDLLFP